jgi:hypothetical protein
MRALVKERPEPGLWFEEQPVLDIGAGDVLVTVRKTGPARPLLPPYFVSGQPLLAAVG